MPEYVALLRAVNVAGHARVSMRDVKAVFERAGCRNVLPVMQSGNVLFESAARARAGALLDVRRALRHLFGEEPQIVLRTLSEIDRLVAAAPFAAYRASPQLKCYVSFLTAAPRRLPRFPLVSAKEALEAIAMDGEHVFVVSRPKRPRFFGFPNNFVEDALGVGATTRNWSTVMKIARVGAARRGD